MKIVIPDWATVSNGDIDIGIFSEYGEVISYPTTEYSMLAERVREADMVLCNKPRMDAQVLEQARNLKYIGLFATGYNNIDTAAARRLGITVCNAGSYSTMAVAQHTFALILDAYSSSSSYFDFTEKGGWLSSPVFSPFVFEQHELSGRTLGIIGFGSIGKAVGRIAEAFGMRVLIHTRTPKGEGEFVSLDRLLAESDIITVHTPLTEQTGDMLRRETFAKCKRGFTLINTSRGGVINENDLAEALRDGTVGRAYLDVLREEPMSAECPLIGAPNLHLTPHIAWAPIETRRRLMEIVRGNIEAFLAGAPKNVVN